MFRRSEMRLMFISSANENTVNAGKKTISPADVFKALEDTEFSFLRAPLEAEFASMTPFALQIIFMLWFTVETLPLNRLYQNGALS